MPFLSKRYLEHRVQSCRKYVHLSKLTRSGFCALPPLCQSCTFRDRTEPVRAVWMQTSPPIRALEVPPQPRASLQTSPLIRALEIPPKSIAANLTSPGSAALRNRRTLSSCPAQPQTDVLLMLNGQLGMDEKRSDERYQNVRQPTDCCCHEIQQSTSV